MLIFGILWFYAWGGQVLSKDYKAVLFDKDANAIAAVTFYERPLQEWIHPLYNWIQLPDRLW